ncbi:MAG: hypothetical protein M1837_000914 [Sclerophora amabilis]|nr:MAG: hypothetical protein M1837_000914 [Sclerophora amabilis]
MYDASPTIDSDALQAINTEPQRRAYETVNYVLRIFDCLITDTHLLSVAALSRALENASAHITDAQHAGMILMQSEMTSIYFIGALITELSTSLPNYKQNPTAHAKMGKKLVAVLQTWLVVMVPLVADQLAVPRSLPGAHAAATAATCLLGSEEQSNIFNCRPGRVSSVTLLQRAKY